ncbi:MAG TPA: hypothetical protein VMW15_09130 [Terracidiphilus sp.]|nr:hypothetical protein [Terracidiphilus sp.]
MTVEFWKSFFDLGALLLLLLTFAFGVGAWFTGNIINRRQAEQIRKFETTLTASQADLAREQGKAAEAQMETAKAQLALESFLNVVGKSVNSRTVESKRFVDLLKGKSRGSAEIWYEPYPEEVHFFALQLFDALGPKGAGWNVEIKPLPTKRENDSRGSQQIFDVLRRTADIEGMAVAAKDVSLSNAQLSALRDAIQLSTGGWGISGLAQFFGDPSLSEKQFVIVIGPHQPNVPIVKFDHSAK